MSFCRVPVKGRNVLVNEKGEVALADFGVSKILSRSSNTAPAAAADESDGTAASSVGNIAGSPCFMAPEVIAGRTPDYKADVWSVGILALELANNGRVPHDELSTPYRIMRAIQTSPAPTLDWTPHGDVAKGAAVAPAAMLLSPSTAGGASTPISAQQPWSHHFHSFVRLCLATNPAQRSDAVSLLSHPFVSNSFSAAVMQPLLKAYEESERKRAKRAKKDSVIAAQQQKTIKPSILDSLFKFLGRKGPSSVRAKIQVDALRSGGRLDEMGEDVAAEEAISSGGSGGAGGSDSVGAEQGGSDTVLINGGSTCVGAAAGSDTVLMGNDGASDDDDDESDLLADEMLGHGTVRNAPPASSSASCSPASSPLPAPAASALPSFPSPASHGASSSGSGAAASHPPAHPPSSAGTATLGPHHSHRKSLGDVLIKCTGGQLAALCHDIGIDAKLVTVLLARATHKFGTTVPAGSPVPSPASLVRKSLVSPAPSSRKSGQPLPSSQHQRQQSPQPRAVSLSPAPVESANSDESASSVSSLSLFPGCPSTPAAGSEESITQLEYSTVCVCGLSRSDLTSLKRMSNAPTPVRMAIESVAIVLGVKPHLVSGAVTRRSGERVKAVLDWWAPAQAVLVKANFLTLLKSYDFTQHLSPDIIDRLHEFSQDKPATLTPQVVASCSMPAAILWNWVRSIYNYAVNCLCYTPKGADPHAEPNALTLPFHATTDGSAAVAAALAAAAAESKENSSDSSISSGAANRNSLPLLAALSPPTTARMNRRGSAGTADPAAALAAAKHRRGTLGHGSQPQLNVHAITTATTAAAGSTHAPAVAAPPSSSAASSGSPAVPPRPVRLVRRTSSGAMLPPSGRSSPATAGMAAAASETAAWPHDASGDGDTVPAAAISSMSAPSSPALAALPTPCASPSPSVPSPSVDATTSADAAPAATAARPAASAHGATSLRTSSAGPVKSADASAVATRRKVGSGGHASAMGSAERSASGAVTARALSTKKPAATATAASRSSASTSAGSSGTSTARTSGGGGSGGAPATATTKPRTSLLPPAHAKATKST